MEKNAILFYKTQFRIAPVNADEHYDLLWQLVQHIRGWLTHKWNRNGKVIVPKEFSEWSKLKNGSNIYTENNKIFLEAAYLCDEETGVQDWACRIVENFELKNGTSPRQWVTEVGFEGQPDGSAEISCILSYSNRAQFIGPYQTLPQPSVPNLIGRIVNDRSLRCTVGTDRVCVNPLELAVGGWPEFLRRVTDSRRKMPYILISPIYDADEEGHPVFLIDPHTLHHMLFGTAQVYFATDPELIKEACYLNPDYACYDGALHVYMPGGRHRWFGAEDIRQHGAEEFMLFIRRAFAESINYYDKYFLIDDCRHKMVARHTGKRMEELKRLHAQAIEKSESDYIEASDLAQKWKTKYDEASDFALEWEIKYDEAATERDNYKAINEEYQKMFEERRDSGDGWQNGSVNALPEMPSLIDRKIVLEDVVGYFRFAFADRMAFTDKVLDGCTLSAQELWKCLYALGTQMIALYRRPDSGEIFREFKRRTGIEVASSEGSSTRDNGSLMRQYNPVWNGETVNIEPHLKCSRYQRIHFGYSRTQDRLVVGHIGRHLDTAGTSRM